MLNEKLVEKLNEQITHEFESSYIYMSMAAYLEHQSYEGFASYMKEQAKEENDHGMRIYNYLNDRGVQVQLGAIPAPPVAYTSVLDVFEKALAHEKFITGKINDLAALATEVKDFATISFLNWFVDEQVEEEATFETHIDYLKRFKEDNNALYLYEQELGKRDFATE